MSVQPFFSIQAALKWSAATLVPSTDTPLLDAQILLAYVLRVSSSHLIAWPDQQLSQAEQEQYQVYIQRRLLGEPLAYIVGTREFWSLEFKVTSATLIPRPETELLVEQVLKVLDSAKSLRVADLGTGCGAIALALAHERPRWEVVATDIRADTLAVAEENASRLGISTVTFQQGSWYLALLGRGLFDAIVSNPPYIAIDDSYLEDRVRQAEPATALFADSNGLAALREIIAGAKKHLKSCGYLFVEHGFQQHGQVQVLFAQAQFEMICSYQDLAGHYRVTGGRLKQGIC